MGRARSLCCHSSGFEFLWWRCCTSKGIAIKGEPYSIPRLNWWIDLDVLIHNSGNNWGAPFEEYVFFFPMKLIIARFRMDSCLGIKFTTTIHTNPETIPSPPEVFFTPDYPYWIHCRNWCPWTWNVCIFRFQSRFASSQQSIGSKTWREGCDRKYHRMRTIRK